MVENESCGAFINARTSALVIVSAGGGARFVSCVGGGAGGVSSAVDMTECDESLIGEVGAVRKKNAYLLGHETSMIYLVISIVYLIETTRIVVLSLPATSRTGDFRIVRSSLYGIAALPKRPAVLIPTVVALVRAVKTGDEAPVYSQAVYGTRKHGSKKSKHWGVETPEEIITRTAEQGLLHEVKE